MYEFFLQQIMTFKFNVSICMFDVVVYKPNLSLGAPTKNVTPQLPKTHPSLGQHRTCIKKTFHFKLFTKTLPKSQKIQNSS